ncbi:MAG: hypothetical protein O3B72_08795 [Proteobacteria bacterium]|nr:hypothetical protein [Pseudomonadota bacterium]
MLIAISGCSTTSRSGDVFRVTIDQPVNLDWGLYQPDSPDRNTLGYQHQGIPGNLAVIPDTTSDQGSPIRVVVLGDHNRPGQQVAVTILGLLEQAGPNGLINTVIATTTDITDLTELETSHAGALVVLEAGLVSIDPAKSRSLGFRNVDAALEAIQKARDRFRG